MTIQNIVELLTSEDDQAYDQPCKWGNQVYGHAVYCHSEVAGYRKCFYRWCSQKEHEENECGGYEPNPAWLAEKENERLEHEAKFPL